MSLLSGILQSQAPPKQDATSTIQTLCLRLSSSTLLEDRRAAILGLRSFARDYQELVASEGLRGLIATLSKDREDLDTVKAVLETLLTLFVKDEANESSEDIALWLADEFTQKQENITVLVDLLDDVDFYIRLYTLQLLAAVSENRPVRTQECVLTAPLGIDRLVGILDDRRDAIRNEVILLLIHLSSGHTDIQKLIAFQNAFEMVFNIIEQEGGVDGGIVAQDCLQLLTNLLSFNFSNQNHFRESGNVPRLAKLFNLSEEEVPEFQRVQRDTNVRYALRLLRLFVVPGGMGTQANQNMLAAAGILHLVLKLAFTPTCDVAVRAEALKTVADLIDGNAPLQQGFAQMQVTPPGVPLKDENGEVVGYYVIEALLDLGLSDANVGAYDARLAACRCLEAYFHGNQPVREHFLRHAIELHSDGDDSANVLTSLLTLDEESRGDPYRVWIATVILIHLIHEDNEVKALATSVIEGDAEAGEEEITAIQTISGNLILALQHNYDTRICIGYLMLLCMWLYEDSDAVDDFLGEGGVIQSLVGAVTSNGVDPNIQGLAAFLLGILYEFSHKESPIPRATLHPILSSRMGRDHYINKIQTLRSSPLIRDFDVAITDSLDEPHPTRKHGLPEIYFDKVFIEFFKENYSHILHAIDKDPGLETRVDASGVKKVTNGVSLELMESLKSQLAEKETELANLENTRLALDHHLTQVQRDAQSARDAAQQESKRLLDALDALRKKNESENATKAEKNRALVDEITKRNRRQIEEKDGQILALKRQLEETTRNLRSLQKELDTLRRQFEDAARKNKTALDERDFQITSLRRQSEDAARKNAASLAEKDNNIRTLQQHLREGRAAYQNLEDQSKSALHKLETDSAANLADAEKRWKETSSWELAAVQTQLEELQQKSTEDAKGHNTALEVLRTEVADARKELEAVTADKDKAIASATADLEKQLAAAKEETANLRAETDKTIVTATAELKAQLASAQEETTRIKSETSDAIESATADLKSQLASAQEETTRIKSETSDSIESATAELKAQLASAQEETTRIKSETSDAIESATADLRTQLAAAEEAAKTAAEDAKTQLAAAQSAANSSSDTELTELRTEFDAAKRSLEESLAKLATAEKERDEAEDAAGAAEAEIKAAREAAQKAQKELDGLREEVEKKESERKEAEEKAEGVQTELDDLFMVLGDLEEKRKKDKERLKGLGEEVSEDEDEDEDDDDDE